MHGVGERCHLIVIRGPGGGGHCASDHSTLNIRSACAVCGHEGGVSEHPLRVHGIVRKIVVNKVTKNKGIVNRQSECCSYRLYLFIYYLFNYKNK